jgi:multidrug efflux pump subunit AcrB
MPKLVGPLQTALSDSVPGAYLDVRQLQTNPVKYPIEIHVFGQADVDPAQEDADIATLRNTAGAIEKILRAIPGAQRIRTDWMEQSPIVQLPINADRANLAGITNSDIARSASGGLSGWKVGTLLDGDSHIPIVARLRQEERAQLADVANLYVYSTTGISRVPLSSLAPMTFQMSQERIVRRDHFRTMTVTAFPAPGMLASQVMEQAMPRIRALRDELPPSYRIVIGGEQSKQEEGFG